MADSLTRQKWFHAIGVVGKTTANVAKMFKDMGWFVTGTDLQFLPPASRIIEENGIPFEQSYSYEHLTKEFWEKKLNRKLNITENPQLVMYVESITPKNKEYLFAKLRNLDVRPYAQIFKDYLVKQNSVVVIGTAGKTTTTALFVHFLSELGQNPSYMIGADVLDNKESLVNNNSNWSVIEGDEYFNPHLSNGAKFLQYKAKYLVVTNVGYEHQDIYRTKDLYDLEFKRAIDIVPQDGIVIANFDEVDKRLLKDTKAKVITYSFSDKDNYKKKQGWKVVKNEDKYEVYNLNNDLVMDFRTDLIGSYNAENILAAIIFTKEKFQGTNNINISEIIQKFKPPKKRLEVLFKNKNTVIIDDFAIAPDRLVNSLKTLRDNFSEHKITAVFEPNSASRPKDEKEFKDMYKGAFDNADQILIPTLSDFNENLANAEEMEKWLKDLGYTVYAIDTEKLNPYLYDLTQNYKILIAFFSSYRLTQNAEMLVRSMKLNS